MQLFGRLGELGIGLVWGWLLAQFSEPCCKPRAKTILLTAATLLMAGEIFLFSDGRGVAYFGAAAAIAILLRLGWYSELKTRVHSSN